MWAMPFSRILWSVPALSQVVVITQNHGAHGPVAHIPLVGSKCQSKDRANHEAYCQRPNYIIKIELLPDFIASPRITRTLSCSATSTFAELHGALQVVFGWANMHRYDFDFFGNRENKDHDSRKQDPDFKIGHSDYNDDEQEPYSEDEDWDYRYYAKTKDSAKTLLFEVLENFKPTEKSIHYNYHKRGSGWNAAHGNEWEHVLTLIGRTDATPYFVCLDGEGHGCAENVGGYSGWKELLQAYQAESPSSAQLERMTWYQTKAGNRDISGLHGERKWIWDKEGINATLQQLACPQKQIPSNPTKDAVLLISLEKQSFFDSTYAETLAKLRSRARVTEVEDSTSAVNHLAKAGMSYAAIIATDPWFMDEEYSTIQAMIADYARAGGIFIMAFHFGCFAHFDKVEKFFAKVLGLDWKYGSYTTGQFSLNPRVNSFFLDRCGPDLPREYGYIKANHIRNTRPEDRVYIADPASKESPAIFAEFGKGHLGFIGNVNSESNMTELLLTMCGV